MTCLILLARTVASSERAQWKSRLACVRICERDRRGKEWQRVSQHMRPALHAREDASHEDGQQRMAVARDEMLPRGRKRHTVQGDARRRRKTEEGHIRYLAPKSKLKMHTHASQAHCGLSDLVADSTLSVCSFLFCSTAGLTRLTPTPSELHAALPARSRLFALPLFLFRFALPSSSFSSPLLFIQMLLTHQMLRSTAWMSCGIRLGASLGWR